MIKYFLKIDVTLKKLHNLPLEGNEEEFVDIEPMPLL